LQVSDPVYVAWGVCPQEARPKSTDEDEPAAPQDAGVEDKKGADKKDKPKEEDEDEDEDDK
jgi:hypothetical protein